METYLTVLQVKMRMTLLSHQLFKLNLLMTNKILPNTVRQALKVIVQVMAMKIPDPRLAWAMIN